jgi:hypothetical protein
MRVFHCNHCDHLLFFENTECVSCHHRVAYLPDLGVIGSLEEDADGKWRSPLNASAAPAYRLCRNYTEEQVCNWAVGVEETNPLCVSCRLTRVIPDLAPAGNRQAWYRLEAAKRRVIVTLLQLHLPLVNREEDPEQGLAFEFKADVPTPDGGGAVLTGHADGVITINIAEADDAERERRRKSLREPYRTLLGHFRHESGHYYWNRLIGYSSALRSFRRLFGDERNDYNAALKAYYDQGPPSDWQSRFVTAYASAHPFEDWAETWAHYLHMIDTIETAAACGLSLKPARHDEPSLTRLPPFVASQDVRFKRLIDSWVPITYVLNNLNRGLGLADAYPFILSAPAIAKLKYVHDLVRRPANASPPRPVQEP